MLTNPDGNVIVRNQREITNERGRKVVMAFNCQEERAGAKRAKKKALLV